jgi:hypothetical protein
MGANNNAILIGGEAYISIITNCAWASPQFNQTFSFLPPRLHSTRRILRSRDLRKLSCLCL